MYAYAISGDVDGHDDVLLSRPRVVRPVRRAAPDRRAVADDELVVHEVRNAGDAARRDRERLDRLRRRLGRRRHRDRPRVVDVVEEPHRHAALHGARAGRRARPRRRPSRSGRRRARGRDVSAASRGSGRSRGRRRRDAARRRSASRSRSPAGRLLRPSPRVTRSCAAARSAALCARFAAWYSASASGESILPRQGCSGTSSCAASTPNWSASTDPRPVIFIAPKPGRAPIRLRRSAASRRLRPDALGLAAVLVGDDRTQLLHAAAIARGKRWIAGRSRNAASSSPGPVAAIAAASSVADPLLQPERPGERLLDGDLLVDREPDEQRERLAAR